MTTTPEASHEHPDDTKTPRSAEGGTVEEAVEDALEFFVEGEPPTPEQLEGNANAPG